jgi:allophanate hydrolase
LQGAQPLRASETFRALHRLAELTQQLRPIFAGIHALLVPTAPTHYRIAQVAADPLGTNARLGRYTNFVNLLDLAAMAVPNGLRGDGLPTGVTFIAPFGHDAQLVSLAARFVGESIPSASPELLQNDLSVAVVGAHLRGQPLNRQLTDLGGRFVRTARTKADYRLYALTDQVPPKPGLVRVAPETGAPIEVEVWTLPRNAFGTFFAQIKSPLGLGSLALDDGQTIAGFLCEAIATASAPDITSFGGWRAYLSGQR